MQIRRLLKSFCPCIKGFCPCLPSSDLYCTLEVDSFGYFVNKAKTRVYRDTTEPNWNEVGCTLLPVTSSTCQAPLQGGQSPRWWETLLHTQHLCCAAASQQALVARLAVGACSSSLESAVVKHFSTDEPCPAFQRPGRGLCGYLV